MFVRQLGFFELPNSDGKVKNGPKSKAPTSLKCGPPSVGKHGKTMASFHRKII